MKHMGKVANADILKKSRVQQTLELKKNQDSILEDMHDMTMKDEALASVLDGLIKKKGGK
jgi:hypothetical protein